MQIYSMYTYWIYRDWLPWKDIRNNPFTHNAIFQPQLERFWRTCWAIMPHMGLMFTAAVPSLSVTSGYNMVLTLVHNLSAPLSLGYLIIMETIQLNFGERAFELFFSDES